MRDLFDAMKLATLFMGILALVIGFVIAGMYYLGVWFIPVVIWLIFVSVFYALEQS